MTDSLQTPMGSCLLGHQWTTWSEPKLRDFPDEIGCQREAYFQMRKCAICNKAQERQA